MNRQRTPDGYWVSAVLLGASLLSATLTGCSVSASTPAPECAFGGSLIIVAQSVPSASRVPCFDPLPNGWSVATVGVNQERTKIVLDSDRAGSSAAVLHFDPSCDVAEAVSAPSEHPETERFDDVQKLAPGFRAVRFYRFEGGCVSWTFDFDDDASATEAVAVGDALQLVSRQELSDQLRETFIQEGL